MNIEEKFHKSCQRKNRYRSREDACQAARSQMIANPASPQIDIYRCAYCPGWHLTSKLG